MVVNDMLDVVGDYGKRSLRMVTRLVDMHLEMAQREAIQEQQRVIGAAIVLSIGATLMTTGFVLVQVFAVLFLYNRNQYWLEVCLGLIGFDLFVGGLLAFSGMRQLRGPYMPETMAQLTKTTSMLLNDEPS